MPSHNSPGLDPSNLRHNRIGETADEAVLNNVHKKKKSKQSPFRCYSTRLHSFLQQASWQIFKDDLNVFFPSTSDICFTASCALMQTCDVSRQPIVFSITGSCKKHFIFNIAKLFYSLFPLQCQFTSKMPVTVGIRWCSLFQIAVVEAGCPFQNPFWFLDRYLLLDT